MKAKFLQEADKFCSRSCFPLLFIPAAFLFLLFFSGTTSPLWPNEGYDSAVFKTMGLALLRGKVLYQDIFDHKGFVLYLINALGIGLGLGRWGLFLLQVIGLSTSLLFLYKTAKLFTSPFKALLSVSLALVFMSGVFDEGNLTEEWNTYLFSISLYIIACFFDQGDASTLSAKDAILLGLLLGLSFFIRPNDAVAQIGGAMVGISLFLYVRKNYHNLIISISFFLLGFAMVSVPILIYFASKGALNDMFYGLLFYNHEYSGSLITMAISTLHHQKLTLLLFLFTLCYLLFCSEKRAILWCIIPMCILQLLLLGTRFFPHYYIILAPLVNLFACTIFSQKKEVKILATAILLLTPFENERQLFNSCINNITYHKITLERKQYLADEFEKSSLLYSTVPEAYKDSIWNYNIGLETLIHSGIVQCNKITVASNQRLLQEDNIALRRPAFVVADPGDNNQNVSDFLTDNYTLFANNDTAFFKLVLYKRNDIL